MAEVVPAYPKRPAFFAMKFIRLMVKSVVATELGQDVFTLLSVIVSTEDSRRYKSPVVFHNGQLLPLLGIKTWDRMDKARDAAVKAGWLVHIPTGRGLRSPSTYWVTIPDGLEDIEDGPVDEGISEYSRGFADGRQSILEANNNPCLIPQNQATEQCPSRDSGYQTRIKHGSSGVSNADQLLEHNKPIPIPFPKETPPEKIYTPETRNKRHPMAETLPFPDAAIHGIEDNGELVMYQDEPERWERALVRWWNLRPGVVPWEHDGLDDYSRGLLYQRMLDPKWTWKRTAGEFPLHFPSDWKPSLDWFLETGNVTKIIGKRYKKNQKAKHAKSIDNTGSTYNGTQRASVGWPTNPTTGRQ